MVVGEVGFPRKEFLHELKWWEISAIIEGYRKRERTFCIMTRWSTFMQMLTGMADIKSAGIYSAEDLVTFPWEHTSGAAADDMPSEEEIAEMRAKLRAENMKKASE